MHRPTPTRRGFLQHLGGAALAATAMANVAAQAETPRMPRVLFMSRAGAYEPAVVRRVHGKLSVSEQLMTALGREIGVAVDCRKDCRVFDGDLAPYDAFILFWNHDPLQPNKAGEPPITPRGKARLIEAVAQGKGLVGIHCAAYAFLSGKQEVEQPAPQRDPYTKMLGGELCGCLAKQTCRYRFVDSNFPGVAALHTTALTLHDEPYGLKNFAADLHVIALLETDGYDMQTRKDKTFPRPPFPCVWARRHERGRVFYMSMGHDEDAWRAPPFQKILSGGLQWTLGRVDADLTPNLATVAPQARNFPQPASP